MNYFAAINPGNQNTNATTSKERDPKFYSELKQLNVDFVKFIDETQQKSPYFDLTPTLNDYIRQFNELERQYPAGSAGFTKPTQLNSQPITFGGGGAGLGTNINSTSNSSNSGFNTSTTTQSIFSLSSANAPTFTAAASTTNTTTTTTSSSVFASTTPFTFGTTTTPAFNLNTTTTAAAATTTTTSSSSLFSPIGSTTTLSFIPSTTSSGSLFTPISSSTIPSFNLGTTTTNSVFNTIGASGPSLFTAPGLNNTAANSTANAATNDDGAAKDGSDEESAPPEPEIDKYEEPDANYQIRCKLYERVKNSSGTASFSHVGTGVLFVKSMDTNTKVQVIVRLEPDLRRVIMNEVITDKTPLKKLEKAVQMVVAVPNGEPKMYVAKVGDPKLANELYEQITSVKSQTVTSTG